MIETETPSNISEVDLDVNGIDGQPKNVNLHLVGWMLTGSGLNFLVQHISVF